LSYSHGRFYFARNTSFVFAVFFSLVGGVAGRAMAAEVTATRLDGTTVVGELRAWNESHVVISSQSGEAQIATEQLVSLRFSTSPATASSKSSATGNAELNDATMIPISSFTVASRMATLKRGSATKSDDALELPIAQVAVVQFQAFDENLTKQWDEIRRLKSASDILVLKLDGKSLDYVEGVVGDIGDDKLDFKFDGETNRVDRAKVAGVIYFRPERPKTVNSHFVVQSRIGLRANAAKVELASSQLVVTTIGGATLKLPIVELDVADFSAGKLMYLSDIEPAAQNWTPLVGLPAGVTLAAEYGQPRRDHSAFGGPLMLLIKDNDDAAAPHGTPRSFNKGIAVRSRTELVYRLPPGYNRLVATAGIDPAARASGNVRLSIFADDSQLLESEISGDQAQPVDVEIAGAKRLKLVVDYGQNFDTGDWLNLCDAKIVK
jgi:NPCBM/NEW2 domain